MHIQAVLFDMFDTLMIIEKNHAFYSPAVRRMHTYLVRNNVPVSFAAFRDAYIKARDTLYEVADETMEEPHFNVRVANALQNLGYSYSIESDVVAGATNAFCQEFMNYIRIDDNAAETLKQLHAKYKLGIVSNFAIPECVMKLLAAHQLTELLDVVIVSAAVNKRKPSPEIFQAALQKLQIAPENAVFVGDTVDADIKGANEVGMHTVYIERRIQKDLEQNCPDVTVKNLNELPSAIEKIEQLE